MSFLGSAFYNEIIMTIKNLSNMAQLSILTVGIVLCFILIISIVKMHYNPRETHKFKPLLFIFFAIFLAFTVWFASVM